VHTVNVIHRDVENHKGSTPKVFCILSVNSCNKIKGPTINAPTINAPTINAPYGDTFYSPIFDNDMMWNQIIQTGDPINVLGDAAVQQAVGSGGDPTQVKGVVQNLALTNSIEGGNTQDLLNNIEMEVAQPNDPVSKSLNSLAVQEEQGNYEAVNTAVEKVAEGVVGGNDVEQLVTTAAATTEAII
jgi:hypothetical protein